MFKLRNRPSTPARTLMSPINDFLRGYKENGEALLAHPFKGITTDGHVVPGLFPIQRTGVSTAPIKDAADAFLASLSAEQSASATFAVDDQAWRRWSNIHARAFSDRGLSGLQRIYDWFKEGFETPDLVESRALLQHHDRER